MMKRLYVLPTCPCHHHPKNMEACFIAWLLMGGVEIYFPFSTFPSTGTPLLLLSGDVF